ncbi:MAG: hypothetical protein IIY70_04950, partial [Oscillospiraceae bacterium]|nr:hypothetical protein [Oscillospiraceae bacterium]
MKNRKLKRWIPLILCASMLLTLIAPFVPGVFAKKEGAAPRCGLEEHTHTETCCNHECLWYCYSDENPTPMSAQGETARAIYENLRARMEAAGAAPQDGTVYRYNDETYSFVNFFYLVGNWYLLGQGDNYSGVLHDPADDPEAGDFNTVAAIKIRESVPHTSRCLLCQKTEHTHTDACYEASTEPESAEAETASVELLWEGYAVNNFVIKPSEKATVEAVPHGLTAPSFQWQILMPQTASWINIGDKTDEKCEISYALVKNMLDDADGTYLRCVVTGSDGVQATTDPLGVTVTPEQEYDEAAMAQSSKADEAVALMISKLRSTVNSFIQPKSVGPDTNPVGAAGEGFVTITIKYLDYQKSMIDHALEEESTVYSPYVATIEQGTPFQQAVVKSPLLVGFAPLYDANNDGVVSDSEDASEIRFDTTANVDTDVEIKVYYKAMNVRYAVRYYFQNIIDDLYTEDSAKYHSGTALAGSIIQSSNLELSPEPVGFVSLFHVPLEVAPDGSTVFECYYDRNYYLVQFVLGDGGYGVDPVYARYGAQVNVGTPSRPGYDFAGWELYKIDENDN